MIRWCDGHVMLICAELFQPMASVGAEIALGLETVLVYALGDASLTGPTWAWDANTCEAISA